MWVKPEWFTWLLGLLMFSVGHLTAIASPPMFLSGDARKESESVVVVSVVCADPKVSQPV